MHSNEIPVIVKCWFTPKFPDVHINKVMSYRPEGFKNLLRDKVRTWVFHPIKRRLAKYYLVFLKKAFGLKVIAITGSAGKTSTKDMLTSILSENRKTVSSYKNIDPVYNIPTTILKCRPSTKYLVLEMGVEYPNEMDYYLWLAKPDIGVITNIYPTHTEFFKNVQGVAREKNKLVKALSKSSTAVLNGENEHLRKIAKSLGSKIVLYGDGSEVRAERKEKGSLLNNKFTLVINKSKIVIQLQVLGRQFISNSLAAASVGYTLGLPLSKIKKGLEKYSSAEHRMKLIKLKSGALILDDSYNNNPEAAKGALSTLKEAAGKRKMLLVFGDMLELGDLEKRSHEELGNMIGSMNFDYVVGVGNLSKVTVARASKGLGNDKVFWAKDWQKALSIIRPKMNKETITLIKGSRSIGLDNLVSRLLR